MNKSTRIIALALLAFSAACSKEATQPVIPPDTTVTPPPPPPPGPVDTSFSMLVAAGNIARCQQGDPTLSSNTNAEATAKLIDSLPTATVLTLGNAANGAPLGMGTAAAYNGCYSTTWGRFLSRTYAAIGNHDYDSTNGNTANAYYTYFGSRAGTPGQGYYSINIGAWHVIVLNTEDPAGAAFYGSSSAQQAWLATDLAANTAKCTLAAFHRARFYSSTTSGGVDRTQLTSLWTKLYDANVDVVLNGGAYQYERMAPMGPGGTRDDAKGLVQFNAGMGGESANTIPSGVHPQSQKLLTSFGVLKLKLRANSLDYAYVNVAGVTEDSGTVTCH